MRFFNPFQQLHRIKLRHKLVLMVFVSALVPLSIMGGVTYYLMKNQMERGLNDLLLEVGTSTVQLMDDYIMERYKELDLVSGSSTLRSGKVEMATYGLGRYSDNFSEFDALLFADTSGRLFAHHGLPLRTKGDAALEQMVTGWVQEARLGARVLDRATPEVGDFSRYLVFVRPVRHEGKDYGWVFGQVDNEKVARFAIGVAVGETGRATLFNRDGILIGHHLKSRYGSDMSHYSIMRDPVMRGIGNPGDFFLSGDGMHKWGMTLMLRRSMDQLGLQWGIIVDQGEAELYAPVTFLRNLLLVLWLFALGIAVVLGIFYSEYIDHANYDQLTGLPNRRLLDDRLAQALSHARRHHRMLAVCYLDLDGFKPVNDRHGHAAGDKLLKEIAKRYQGVVRENDTVARLGGDEFVLLFNDLNDRSDAIHLLERLLAVTGEPFQFKHQQAVVSASIGVCLYPTHGCEADALLFCADKALYQAKEQGKSRFVLWEEEAAPAS